MTHVRYWVFNYMPEWEAVSKEIATLLDGLGDPLETSLISLNTADRRLQLSGRVRRVPLPYGFPFYPFVRRHAATADINHLFASAGERWLSPLLTRRGSVLTVAKGSGSLAVIARNAERLKAYRAVVVQSDRDRDLMRQVGVAETALHLIRPGVPLSPYRAATGRFTILFASSPLSAEDFLSRGIHLIVRVASRLPDVRFILVWRRRHVEMLRRMIAEAAVGNIEVEDGVIPDMGAMYDRVHAAILPALEHRSFVPAPRSGLEALAHGKPLLVSTQVSIAPALQASHAGVVFEPSVEGLESAVRQLQRSYDALQPNAQRYLKENFSPSIHLELHRRLYQSLGT
jgi:glycosyltransferase involved in cell wall biosynthesis